ncbi:MAG: hypothetical protein EOO28_08040 [Comamonadaceae bacterium]|nr:MAG: hypothetical protein EOO28_08040 [Comamonadaceae bacterium]
MPRSHARSTPCIQRGWSLVEGAVVIALLGLMAVVVLSTLESSRRQQSIPAVERDLARAEDAVFGYALARFHFPVPTGAAPSPGRPGFVEGWFPAQPTGFPGVASRAMRYRVEESLTRLPDILYRPDPLSLAGHLIADRVAANGVDFCAALFNGVRADSTLKGDVQPAFSLESVDPNVTVDMDMDVDVNVNVNVNVNVDVNRSFNDMKPQRITRSAGRAASASRLGCLARLSNLAAAVKATAASADLGKLAAQRVAFRALLVAIAAQSVSNLEWQEANLAAGMTRYALDETFTLAQLKSTPLNLAKGFGTLVTISVAIAGTAISISQTRASLARAEKKRAVADENLQAARQHEQALAALTRRQALRANGLLAGE